MTWQGMDAEAVEQAARDLSRDAGHWEQVVREIDGLIARAAGVWSGTDADRYREQWSHRHRGELTRIAETLRGLSRSLLAQVAAQREVSATLTGGGFGATGASGGTLGAAAAVLTRPEYRPFDPTPESMLRPAPVGPGGSGDPGIAWPAFEQRLRVDLGLGDLPLDATAPAPAPVWPGASTASAPVPLWEAMA